MPPHKGGRSDQARATIYQKHRPPQSRKTMYGGWRLPSAGRSRKLVTWWQGSRRQKPRWTAIVTITVLR